MCYLLFLLSFFMCVQWTQAFEYDQLLSVQGMMSLEGVKFPGLIEVKGKFICKRSKLGVTVIHGDAEILNSEINGRAAFSGNVFIEGSNLTENLEITSKRAVITASELNTILIFPIKGYDGKRILELHNGTKIKGSVVFYSKNGHILMSKDSNIHAEVIGAEIEMLE